MHVDISAAFFCLCSLGSNPLLSPTLTVELIFLSQVMVWEINVPIHKNKQTKHSFCSMNLF